MKFLITILYAIMTMFIVNLWNVNHPQALQYTIAYFALLTLSLIYFLWDTLKVLTSIKEYQDTQNQILDYFKKNYETVANVNKSVSDNIKTLKRGIRGVGVSVGEDGLV
jgi:hypothetical protein